MKYNQCINLACIIGGIAIVLVYVLAFYKANDPKYLVIPLSMCAFALGLILFPLFRSNKIPNRRKVEE